MRASRLWAQLAFGCLLWSAPAVSFAQAQTNPSVPTTGTGPAVASPAPQTQSPSLPLASGSALEDEDGRLERLAAVLSIQNQILKEVNSKKW